MIRGGERRADVQGVPVIAALIRLRLGLGAPGSPFSTSCSLVAWYRIALGSPRGRASEVASGRMGSRSKGTSASGGNMNELRFCRQGQFLRDQGEKAGLR